MNRVGLFVFVCVLVWTMMTCSSTAIALMVQSPSSSSSQPPVMLPFEGSQFRYDFYLSDSYYPELWAGAPPTNKGRYTIVVKQSNSLSSEEEYLITEALKPEGSSPSSTLLSVLFNLNRHGGSNSSSFEILLDPKTVDPLKESKGLVDWVRAEINDQNTRRAVISLHTSNVSGLLPHLERVSIRIVTKKIGTRSSNFQEKLPAAPPLTWGSMVRSKNKIHESVFETTRTEHALKAESPAETIEKVRTPDASSSSPLTHAAPTTPVIISHVASIKNFSQLVVHLKAPTIVMTSHSQQARLVVNVTSFEINGQDFVPAQNAAAGGSSSSSHGVILLYPGDHYVFTTPVFLRPIMGEGFVWTVLMNYSTAVLQLQQTQSTVSSSSSWTPATQMGNGGRLVKEVFFQEAWQHSNIKCPLPIKGEGSRTDDDDAENAAQYHQFHEVGGLNTFMPISCKNATDGQTFAEEHGIFWMAAHQDDEKGSGGGLPWTRNRTATVEYPVSENPGNHTTKKREVVTNQVASVFCGDEVDGNPAHNGMKAQLQKVLEARKFFPFNPTYQGAKTSHYVGTYAGITDIQGLDFYVAACAPHITPTLTPMNLQGAFDYLWNVRNNHQPLPMWGYTQALEGGWNTNISTPEFIIQIGSAVLAGTKSLMQFMASTSTMYLPQFTAGGKVVRSLSAVGDFLRAGDIGGSSNITVLSRNSTTGQESIAFSSPTWVRDYPLPKLMSEMVIGPTANSFLILVANFDAGKYNDLLCEIDIDLHWVWTAHPEVTVIAELPPQIVDGGGHHLKIKSFGEALDGEVLPVGSSSKAPTVSIVGTQLHLGNVSLGTDQSVFRVFFIEMQEE